MTPYPPPVDRLLTLGELALGGSWANYSRLGIGPEHIPELIRLMTDMQLNLADSNKVEVWAPVHAWRALAHLRAAEAVEPFLNLLVALDKEGTDDWIREEAPEFFARIGPATVPVLAAFLAEDQHSLYARWATADALAEMALKHPETRPEVLSILTGQLERAADNDPELNGGIIASLLDLQATEAAPVMERAFATGNVDETIAGDWEIVQYELGLREEPPAKSGYFGMSPLPDLSFAAGPDQRRVNAKRKAKAKAKRKMAKRSRKQNRKKKR